METTIVYKGFIGIMEKKMETTIVYKGYIGIMERKWKLVLGLGTAATECIASIWNPTREGLWNG